MLRRQKTNPPPPKKKKKKKTNDVNEHMRLSEAMFTQDRFQTDPVRKSDRIGLMFTRDLSGTGPERIQTGPNTGAPSSR